MKKSILADLFRGQTLQNIPEALQQYTSELSKNRANLSSPRSSNCEERMPDVGGFTRICGRIYRYMLKFKDIYSYTKIALEEYKHHYQYILK